MRRNAQDGTGNEIASDASPVRWSRQRRTSDPDMARNSQEFGGYNPLLGVICGNHSVRGLVPPSVLDEFLKTLLRDLGQVDPEADKALRGIRAPDLLIRGGVIGDGLCRLLMADGEHRGRFLLLHPAKALP